MRDAMHHLSSNETGESIYSASFRLLVSVHRGSTHFCSFPFCLVFLWSVSQSPPHFSTCAFPSPFDINAAQQQAANLKGSCQQEQQHRSVPADSRFPCCRFLARIIARRTISSIEERGSNRTLTSTHNAHSVTLVGCFGLAFVLLAACEIGYDGPGTFNSCWSCAGPLVNTVVIICVVVAAADDQPRRPTPLGSCKPQQRQPPQSHTSERGRD